MIVITAFVVWIATERVPRNQAPAHVDWIVRVVILNGSKALAVGDCGPAGPAQVDMERFVRFIIRITINRDANRFRPGVIGWPGQRAVLSRIVTVGRRCGIVCRRIIHARTVRVRPRHAYRKRERRRPVVPLGF